MGKHKRLKNVNIIQLVGVVCSALFQIIVFLSSQRIVEMNPLPGDHDYSRFQSVLLAP